MTRVRQVDDDGDWLFGKGQNDYVVSNTAVAQNINTRLGSFLGDCFFDLGGGIDWFNLLGTKDQVSLNLSISAVILNTLNVTGILQLTTSLSDERVFTVTYRVQTSYSTAASVFQFDLNGIG